MKAFRSGVYFLMISIIFIAGCGSIQDTLDRNELENYLQETSEDAPWPDYIPAEIPELHGEIRTIMAAPDSHIRLFYINVPDEQIEEYLDLLVDQGFKLEYRIHVQEGFPDKSEERRQRGEYDDIDITKGEYHMTLSHWEGSATYDVYTSGFREEAIVATALQWPTDLPESVPQIPRCVLQTINPGHIEGYDITCRQEAENVEQEYTQLLLDAGFEEKNGIEYQNHVLVMTVFENDEAIVIPSGVFSPVFTIEVIIKSEPLQLQWPTVFDNLVPRPLGCELTYVASTSQVDKCHIKCQPEHRNVLAEYVSTLEELGFVEDFKFLNQQDEITWISLYNGEIKVDITIDLSDSMSVRVAPMDP